jgi:hypothetical protein
LEEVNRIGRAQLGASEACEGPEQARREKTVLLREKPVAQDQGLRAQII